MVMIPFTSSGSHECLYSYTADVNCSQTNYVEKYDCDYCIFYMLSWIVLGFPSPWREPLLLLCLFLPLLSSCRFTDRRGLSSTKSPSPTGPSPTARHPVSGQYASAHGCQQGWTSTLLTHEPVQLTNARCQRTCTPGNYLCGEQGAECSNMVYL